MNALHKSLVLLALLISGLAVRAVAAPPQAPAKAPSELDKVLDRLDASSKTFQSAQANLIWDHVQTQPFEDKDSQAGTVIFERDKGEMRLAMHIKTDNGKPALKDVVYANGVGKMYQPSIKQMQVFKVGDNRAALDAFLTLGFGGSGEDLKKSWKIAYAATEPVNGATTAKLELTPLDPKVAQSTTKVTLWVDMGQGVVVKQQRFSPDKSYATLTYSEIRLNVKVPSGAFDIKPAPGTEIQMH